MYVRAEGLKLDITGTEIEEDEKRIEVCEQ
jgi:hypothetical protein